MENMKSIDHNKDQNKTNIRNDISYQISFVFVRFNLNQIDQTDDKDHHEKGQISKRVVIQKYQRNSEGNFFQTNNSKVPLSQNSFTFVLTNEKFVSRFQFSFS